MHLNGLNGLTGYQIQMHTGAAALGGPGACSHFFGRRGRNILWPPHFRGGEKRSAREAREMGNVRTEKGGKNVRARFIKWSGHEAS